MKIKRTEKPNTCIMTLHDGTELEVMEWGGFPAQIQIRLNPKYKGKLQGHLKVSTGETHGDPNKVFIWKELER